MKTVFFQTHKVSSNIGKQSVPLGPDHVKLKLLKLTRNTSLHILEDIAAYVIPLRDQRQSYKCFYRMLNTELGATTQTLHA